MSKEKQIEEMAKIISLSIQFWAQELPEIPCPVFVAQVLYNAGYCKRSEGEWGILKMGDGEKVRTCSACHISQTVNVYKGKVMFMFCPYCGAKMKGGE